MSKTQATVCLCLRSVNQNRIRGEAAEQLAKIVLDHKSLVNFGGILIDSLRNNSMDALDLEGKGIGVPGALVLGSLLPSATALRSCK